METPKLPEFSSEVGINVVENLEAHYRKLFNASYDAACNYAHILVALHDFKVTLHEGYTQQKEVTELERWFHADSHRTDGCERTDGGYESNIGTA